MTPPATLVSVVIPTRDCRELVLQAVRSVQRQTWPAWEAVVVDDRSGDGTLDAVRALAQGDPRIVALARRGDRGGAPVCRNQGLAAARGDLVVFLDADDLLDDGALRARTEFLQRRPACDAAVSLCRMFTREPGDSHRLFNTPTSEPDLDRFLHFDNPWGTLCVTWRRAALARLGPWDEGLPSWQDWDYHVRALSEGLRCCWKVDEPDCHCRQAHPASIGSSSHAPPHLESHAELLRRTEQRLRDRGLWTAQRRSLLHGALFWIAQAWAHSGDRARALRSWREDAVHWQVPRSRYLLGRVLLQTARRPRLQDLGQRLARRVWPPTMFPWQSRTYLK